MSYSVPRGRFPRVTHPSATISEEIVRLACVKHAASVRSEPGSNSQVHRGTQPGLSPAGHLNKEPSFAHRADISSQAETKPETSSSRIRQTAKPTGRRPRIPSQNINLSMSDTITPGILGAGRTEAICDGVFREPA